MPVIRVCDQTYKELIKAKATLELQEERNISMDTLINRMLDEFPKIDMVWETEEQEQPKRSQPS